MLGETKDRLDKTLEGFRWIGAASAAGGFKGIPNMKRLAREVRT